MKSSKLIAAQSRMRKRYGVDPDRAIISEKPADSPVSQDRHFSVNQVSEMWGLHPSTVRRIFGDVKGVLKLGKGNYKTLCIPTRLLQQVHEKLAA